MKRRERTKANIIDRLIIIFLPIILGVVGTIVIKWLYGKYILIEAEDGLELVKTVFDVWGILLGFIFTAVSILLTIGENILLETNHMQNIIFSYVISGLLLLISIVFALVLMFVKIWNTFVLYVFIGINIAIIVSIAICVCFLFKIILNMNK